MDGGCAWDGPLGVDPRGGGTLARFQAGERVPTLFLTPALSIGSVNGVEQLGEMRLIADRKDPLQILAEPVEVALSERGEGDDLFPVHCGFLFSTRSRVLTIW